MAGFPSIAPRSLDIIVGSRALTPYQWAAQLAPNDKLIAYKNAMLWLEGEIFGSVDEFLGKVERIVKFQAEEIHQPTATTIPKLGEAAEKEDTEEESSTKPVKETGWEKIPKKKRKPKKPIVRLTRRQLAKAIVDGCLNEMRRVYSYTGPSLRISDVYSRFDPKEFTYPGLIADIRTEIQNLSIPSQCGMAAKTSARFWAESSAGKGKNFNFKVQEPDSGKPNGWSAKAQVHVLWQ